MCARFGHSGSAFCCRAEHCQLSFCTGLSAPGLSLLSSGLQSNSVLLQPSWDALQEAAFLAFSPDWGWPLEGVVLLLWPQCEGLGLGAQILAEAVRWSKFSCYCRGDFPVVIQLWLVSQLQTESVLLQDYWDCGGCYCLSLLGCWCFSEGVSTISVSAAMWQPEDTGQDPAVGMRLDGFLGAEVDLSV